MVCPYSTGDDTCLVFLGPGTIRGEEGDCRQSQCETSFSSLARKRVFLFGTNSDIRVQAVLCESKALGNGQPTVANPLFGHVYGAERLDGS